MLRGKEDSATEGNLGIRNICNPLEVFRRAVYKY